MNGDDADLRRQQTSLSFIDWDHVAQALGVTLGPVLRPGTEHLLPDSHLRAHLVTTLLGAGVHPHELHLDATQQIDRGSRRIDLRLDLDTGISTAIAVIHPHARERGGRRSGRVLAASWLAGVQRATVHVAHEHITVVVLGDGDVACLRDHLVGGGVGWVGQGCTVVLGGEVVSSLAGSGVGRVWGGLVQVTGVGAWSGDGHQVLVFQSHRVPDEFPSEVRQPGLW